jgi:hypothetical protein
MEAGEELELQPFECPRCGSAVEERFWGPCGHCRAELTAAQRGEAPEVGSGRVQSGRVQSGRFEPAMHVVPNHVATKD